MFFETQTLPKWNGIFSNPKSFELFIKRFMLRQCVVLAFFYRPIRAIFIDQIKTKHKCKSIADSFLSFSKSTIFLAPTKA